MRLSVSSVFMILYGIFGIGLSMFFLLAGFAAGFISGVPGLDSLASVGLLALGGLFLVMGILGIISGVWLWGGKLYGIYTGIPLLTIGCMFAVALSVSVQTLTIWEISGIILAVNVTLLVLLFVCWQKLSPELP